ncbi:MAG: hypothetical protein HQK87_01540 [Nitrospinae bacterium]|nr:hypothetical protein [Nitrospinota bacterium]
MRIAKIRFLPTLMGVAFLVVAASLRADAGAWGQPEGKLYDKLSANYYVATQYYDDTGKRRSFPYDGRFTDLNLSNYIEYGITDSLTLVATIALKRIETSDKFATTSTSGVGDVELGVKGTLGERAYGVLSHQITIKAPGFYDKTSRLPLGNGQLDIEYRLLLGASLWRFFPGYANLEAGYRYRAEAPSDEFRYLAEIGGEMTGASYARAKLDGVVSMRNEDPVTDQGGNPTTVNRFSVVKLDLAVGYRLGGTWGVEAGYTAALNGENTADGVTWSLGITYQIR